jgi:hypothetical protein
MYKEFLTGLISFDKEINPKPPYNGAGWSARFEKASRKVVDGKELQFSKGNEVLINAKSWVTAQRALNLILASLYLVTGHPPILSEGEGLVAHNDSEPQNLGHIEETPRNKREFAILATVDIPLACAMAAKVSRKTEFSYALFKYNFSITLFKSEIVDIDPFHSLQQFSYSPFHYDHILFSHCIISAYSVLEELGLEIRASQEKPSIINGEWNSQVKNDLENRLKNSGINLSEKLLWVMRGNPKKIELKKPPKIKSKMWWSRGNVRDAEIEIVDAILYASWLRSKVSSHKIKELTRYLTPYDVENVQHLARRLLLESLGFWRYL